MLVLLSAVKINKNLLLCGERSSKLRQVIITIECFTHLGLFPLVSHYFQSGKTVSILVFYGAQFHGSAATNDEAW